MRFLTAFFILASCQLLAWASQPCTATDGHVLTNGSVMWVDDCVSCICDEGSFKCTGTPCNATQCVTPNATLVSNGGKYDLDHCTTCTCMFGDPVCSKKSECMQTSAPAAPSCIADDRVYANGTVRWIDDCVRCMCDAGKFRCTGTPCPATSCVADDRVYANGTVRWVDNCVGCRCDAGKFRCTGNPCNATQCVTPNATLVSNGGKYDLDQCTTCTCMYGDPVCSKKSECMQTSAPAAPSCIADDRVYANGTVRWIDDCVRCMCDAGKFRCTGTPCPATSCVADDRVYANGTVRWIDDCVRCTCDAGMFRCTGNPCNATQCVTPNATLVSNGGKYDLDQCTTCTCMYGDPVCSKKSECMQTSAPAAPSCIADDRVYANGTVRWIDDCVRCMCDAGKFRCTGTPCPATSCVADDRVYANGTVRWVDNCVGCRCDAGKFRCTGNPCNATQCVTPNATLVSNGGKYDLDQCTTCTCMYGDPVCSKKSECMQTSAPAAPSCIADDRVYANGTVRWIDDCVRCMCDAGKFRCTGTPCPATSCVADDRVYANGTVRWIDDCVRCTCDAGMFRCTGNPCNATQCVTPNATLVSNGGKYDLDQCTTCTCMYGDPVCSKKSECMQTSAPAAPSCIADDRVYANGTVRWIDDCVRCMCDAGKFRCTGTPCPATSCVADDRVYANGTVRWVDNCVGCRCDAGKFRCTGNPCNATQCVTPNATLVSNGGKYDLDQCTTCTCMYGDPVCSKKSECMQTSAPAAPSCIADDRVYANGTVRWIDDCVRCMCDAGKFRCTGTPCPATSCVADDRVYANGTVRWIDDCVRCTCDAGMFRCTGNPCNATQCVTPNATLVSNGGKYDLDQCTTCTCMYGDPVCSKKSECMQTSAPAAPSCIADDRVYANGTVRWIDDCVRCMCDAGKFRCTGTPCPATSCVADDRVYANGTVRWIDDCVRCTCDAGMFRCTGNPCNATQCVTPNATLVSNGGKYDLDQCTTCTCMYGDPVCSKKSECMQTSAPAAPSCIADDRVYANGTVRWIDDCVRCMCDAGKFMCTGTPCPATSCVADDRVYANGTVRWVDNCVGCRCDAGKFRCTGNPCNATQCVTPNATLVSNGGKYDLDQCTTCTCMYGDPVCSKKSECMQTSAPAAPSCIADDRVYANGTVRWIDDCVRCMCDAGKFRCTGTPCPATSCVADDRVYANGTVRWVDNCVGCRCDAGKFRCTGNPCNATQCVTPNATLVSNGGKYDLDQCTTCTCMYGDPVCSKKSECMQTSAPAAPSCIADDRVYANGTVRWIDDCVRCMCDAGKFRCTGTPCPATSCVADDRVYANGTVRWIDDCVRCTCDAGMFRCTGNPCNATQCVTPNATLVSNGGKYDLDQCTTCTCMYGDPVCSKKSECMQTSAPAAPSCIADDRVYANGTVRWIDDCVRCMCDAGKFRCTGTPCPATSCVADDRVYANGTVRWVDNCVGCRCDAGKFRCTGNPCNATQCVTPNATLVSNGGKYDLDQCTTCTCMYGDPVCSKKSECMQTSAPAAPSCIADDRVYANGTVRWIDDCVRCMCDAGKFRCTGTPCPATSCVADDRVYANGTVRWVDNCVGCRCDAGKFRCTGNPCNATQCVTPNATLVSNGGKYDLDQCTTCTCMYGDPVCSKKSECMQTSAPAAPSCIADDRVYANGTVRWIDDCVRCMCDAGKFRCTGTPCPATSCVADDRVYANGTVRWVDNCVGCRCDAGKFRCTGNPCNANQCVTPYATLVSNGGTYDLDQCTTCTCMFGDPVCSKKSQCVQTSAPGAPASCVADNRVYANGSVHWVDDCVRCMCDAGKFRCTGTPCPSTSCMADDRVYANGTVRWVDDCVSCRCDAGKFRCSGTPCKATQCVTPNATLVSNGRKYDVDRCTTCTCMLGDPVCEHVDNCTAVKDSALEHPGKGSNHSWLLATMVSVGGVGFVAAVLGVVYYAKVMSGKAAYGVESIDEVEDEDSSNMAVPEEEYKSIC
ncbi:hypothetical protein DIPPA_70078 [Diplonema papillatum]|nr:hypothetical protein DIPPA_70078 [Diplonema papillatum]